MANNLESVIHTIVSRATSELAQEIAHVVRRTIAEEIAGSVVHASPSVARGRKVADPASQPARGKGSRRSSADVAADDNKILAYIKSNPGLRSVEIGQAVKLPKTSMASGLLRLRASKKIKTKGQRSATTYTAA